MQERSEKEHASYHPRARRRATIPATLARPLPAAQLGGAWRRWAGALPTHASAAETSPNVRDDFSSPVEDPPGSGSPSQSRPLGGQQHAVVGNIGPLNTTLVNLGMLRHMMCLPRFPQPANAAPARCPYFAWYEQTPRLALGTPSIALAAHTERVRLTAPHHHSQVGSSGRYIACGSCLG